MTERLESTTRKTGYGSEGTNASDPTGGAETLPAPTSATTTVSGNDLMVLRSLFLKMSDASIATGKAKIEKNDVLITKAIEDAAEARKRAAEARSEKGGFFDGLAKAAEALTVDLVNLETITDPFGALERSLDKAGDATINSRQFWADLEKGGLEVAKWGAVAGSVVLAVGSLGAAAPVAALAIVGAVMSCAATADSTFHILEKCGVKQDTAMWIDVGLCIGGALCSGGSGVIQMASSQTHNVGTALRVGAIIADGSAGAGAATGGVAHIEVAAFERDAKMADADATDADMTQGRLERRIQQTMDAIRETYESCERGTRRVADAMNKETATTVALMVRA
jgi:hypothetical protein